MPDPQWTIHVCGNDTCDWQGIDPFVCRCGYHAVPVRVVPADDATHQLLIQALGALRALAEHVRDDAMSRGLDHYPAALIDAEDLLDGFPHPLGEQEP